MAEYLIEITLYEGHRIIKMANIKVVADSEKEALTIYNLLMQVIKDNELT